MALTPVMNLPRNHNNENVSLSKPKQLIDRISKDTHLMMRTMTRKALNLEEKKTSRGKDMGSTQSSSVNPLSQPSGLRPPP
jgi:hypothetical protein